MDEHEAKLLNGQVCGGGTCAKSAFELICNYFRVRMDSGEKNNTFDVKNSGAPFSTRGD